MSKLPPSTVLITILLLTLPAATGRGGEGHHVNFFRGPRRRQAYWCGDDPVRACSDPEREYWAGGRTCCFGRVCKDTLRDGSNCGGCGKKCAFGFDCCEGECVDTRNDPRHCGACFRECPSASGGRLYCSFGMCDYAG